VKRRRWSFYLKQKRALAAPRSSLCGEGHRSTKPREHPAGLIRSAKNKILARSECHPGRTAGDTECAHRQIAETHVFIEQKVDFGVW
jgi:hypothetical protein